MLIEGYGDCSGLWLLPPHRVPPSPPCLPSAPSALLYMPHCVVAHGGIPADQYKPLEFTDRLSFVCLERHS